MQQPHRVIIRRAYHLHRLISEGCVNPHRDELMELAPQLFEILPLLDDDTLFAQGALALVYPIRWLGRLSELPFFMRQVMSRLPGSDLAVEATLYLAHYMVLFRDLAACEVLLNGLLGQGDGLSPELKGRYWRVKASLLTDSGETEEAAELLEQAQHFVKARGLYFLEYGILCEIAILAIRRGDYERAIEPLERAQVICVAHLRDDSATHRAAVNLAVAYFGARRYALAGHHFEQLRQSALVKHDHDQVLIAQVNLCQTMMVRGLWDDAAELLSEIDHVALNKGVGLSTVMVMRAILHAVSVDTSLLEPAARHAKDESMLGNRACALLFLHLHQPHEYPEFPAFESNEFVSKQVWARLAGEAGVVEHDLNAIELHLMHLAHASNAVLYVRDTYSAFSCDGETWCDLKRRHTAQKLLRALCEAWPEAVNSWMLLEQVWPERALTSPDALNVLYTAMHRLRALGLEEHIERLEEGYVLTCRIEHTLA